MEFNNSIIDVIKRRKSVRSYSNQDIDSSKITEYLSGVHRGPFNNTARFHLLENVYKGEYRSLRLGTYGTIKGVNHFIAGAVKKNDKHIEDYGYCLEKVMLFLTDIGLGTCWLGGLFTRSRFAKSIKLKQDEEMPAITTVGHAADKRALMDKIIRISAGCDSRKPWEQLFFEDKFGNPLTKESAEKYSTVLEMLRIAPSASNRQPWRVIKEKNKDNYHFYLKRNNMYGKLYRKTDLQKIDMGIAMCHFELTAKELNLSGSWKAAVHPEETEYLVSWVSE